MRPAVVVRAALLSIALLCTGCGHERPDGPRPVIAAGVSGLTQAPPPGPPPLLGEGRRSDMPGRTGTYQWHLPRGLPVPPVPDGNPMTEAKVALGRSLFYDRRLSGSGEFACATCHQQRLAFTDGRARAVGATGARHARSAMSLANVAYNATYGWADETLTTLEQQMAVPLFNEHPVEMGLRGREADVLARFSTDADAARFRAAFPEAPALTLDHVVKAIAAFERTLVSGDAPLDRYVYRDERAALSDSARRGLELFFSDRLRCVNCHGGFNLSGPTAGRTPVFHNTGLVDAHSPAPDVDRGLFDVTKNPGDRGRFRAPTLRNIAVTAPYMHDGSIATLEEAIAHYATGGRPGTSASRMMRPFTLTAAEVADVVAFLHALTDERFLTNPAFADPAAAAR